MEAWLPLTDTLKHFKMIGGERLGDNITEEYWSRFPDTYDKKMEYVVGKELRNTIIQERMGSNLD